MLPVRNRRRARLLAFACGAALALTACGDDAATPSPTPSASPSPSLSNEELVEEAREVYEGYLAAIGDMWETDDSDYTLLTPWTSREQATDEAAAQRSLREEGVAHIGPMRVQAISLVTIESSDSLEVAVCIDFTDARYTNTEGTDVTPTDNEETGSVVALFERSDDDQLRVTQQRALPEGSSSPCEP